MKSIFQRFTLGVTLACATGFSVCAAPLQRTDVMADPAWLLHLDADALRPTAIGKYILAQLDKPEARDKLADLQAIFSIDIRTQLHGFTRYGTTPSPEDGVLIAYADFDAERLVTLAKGVGEYQSTHHNKHVIHSWVVKKKVEGGEDSSRVFASIVGNRVVFSRRETDVAKVLDVMDGASPSLASGAAFPELGAPGDSYFLEAAATKINFPNSNPSAAILKLSKSVQLTFGETHEQLHGALTLIADNEDVAQHILSIAQGLIALMKIQTDKSDIVAIANALAVKQNGSSVIVTLALPADKVVTIIKADAARKAAARDANQ
ncbi:MAG TPA: hypothetical protein VH413_12350 [Verrucomicrobiae bacterium]|jgi:hypothetical protein|nr:hypothetical protein [Verrucomicrobiae bacterium]